MRILLTNDDGIHAEGLADLAQAMKKYGEVKVVAPDRERSACGHAMTLRDPLRATKVPYGSCEAWHVNGLPVDCVNIGLRVAFPDGCDLIVSGINHGPNLGFDITYSGTVGGAMEGAINGIRSLALSMFTVAHEAPLHFETASDWIERELGKWLEVELPRRTFLNINIPSIAIPELGETVVTRMGGRVYEDRVEPRTDPWGRTYYWQGGVVVMKPDDPGSDVEAVSLGKVSVTPISLDWTSYPALESLRSQVIPFTHH